MFNELFMQRTTTYVQKENAENGTILSHKSKEEIVSWS